MNEACGAQTDELSDVAFDKPADVNYHFNEVWGADVVARATGYRGEGGAKLAEFLEALASAYDATRRLEGLENNWTDGIMTSDLRSNLSALLVAGCSIIDAPDELGESWMRIVACATNCIPSKLWTWEEIEWVKLEAYLQASSAIDRIQMAAQFNITRTQAEMLLALYGREHAGSSIRKRKEVLVGLFEDHPEWSARQLADHVNAMGFKPMSVEAVRRHRQRWQGGDLQAA